MKIGIKRVYEPASGADGARVLVDRLWPRGLTKAGAEIDEWLRDLAPSHDLRRWFHALPEPQRDFRWPSFRKQYLKELSQPEAQDSLLRLYQLSQKRKCLTLLFSSKNETRNNAVVLKELLDGMRKPPTGTGPGAIHSMRRREAAIRRR